MGDPVVVGISRRLDAEQMDLVRRAAAAGGRDVEVRAYRGRDGLDACLPELEVLFGGVRSGQAARAPRLRWIQAESAGVDYFPLEELRAARITLTTARGLYDDAMAEHALALLLAMTRRIPEAVREQDASRWVRHEPGVLVGSRLGILGFGSIGRAVAVRAQPLGVEIWATRGHPRPDPLVRRMFGPSRAELMELLSACDSVVAVLPSTSATRGILDAEALAAMPAGARIVNIGRGDLIVEGALDAALRSGHLGGAGLDCPPRDPLPPDSPLWTAPGVLITPHVGGAGPDNGARGMRMFADNLSRYCRREPLANVVDLEAGY